jgi:hypothetical protein
MFVPGAKEAAVAWSHRTLDWPNDAASDTGDRPPVEKSLVEKGLASRSIPRSDDSRPASGRPLSSENLFQGSDADDDFEAVMAEFSPHASTKQASAKKKLPRPRPADESEWDGEFQGESESESAGVAANSPASTIGRTTGGRNPERDNRDRVRRVAFADDNTPAASANSRRTKSVSKSAAGSKPPPAADDDLLEDEFAQPGASPGFASQDVRSQADTVELNLLDGDERKVPGAVAGKPQPSKSIEEIQRLIDKGELYHAQRELSRRYWRNPDEREELRPKLDEIAGELFFSPQPHFEEPYVVQPGDQMRVIAQRYRISWDYLARLNHTEPRKLRATQRLKVVRGPFSAIISLSAFELVVHLRGVYVRSYRCGAGTPGTTPKGTFTVKNKLKNPTYYGPDGVIAADDPANPLGERWIDIGNSYGIHGTIEPRSIGRNESRGCIRLLNDDIDEVYDLLTIGSTVRIQE